ncbi:uncharacterized protein [Montipora capricornis]|uniref:uncharacterized protein isoform X2 n=1 Tax=Montipora capricornis TaxID=246305 RepID=UPI0035F1FC9C
MEVFRLSRTCGPKKKKGANILLFCLMITFSPQKKFLLTALKQAEFTPLRSFTMSQSAWNPDDPLTEGVVYEKRLADDIGQKWKDLGRALGFHQASIDNIEQEKGNNSKECCIEVLVRWLRRDGKEGATAGNLAEALTKIGLKNLADRFPTEPSDTKRNDKIEETVRTFCEQLISFLKDEIFQMSNRIKLLKEKVSRLRARNKELQDGGKQKVKDLEDKPSLDMKAREVSEQTDEEARERRISTVGCKCHGKNKRHKRKIPRKKRKPHDTKKNLTALTKNLTELTKTLTTQRTTLTALTKTLTKQTETFSAQTKILTAQKKTARHNEKLPRQKCQPGICGRFSKAQKYYRGWRI